MYKKKKNLWKLFSWQYQIKNIFLLYKKNDNIKKNCYILLSNLNIYWQDIKMIRILFKSSKNREISSARAKEIMVMVRIFNVKCVFNLHDKNICNNYKK